MNADNNPSSAAADAAEDKNNNNLKDVESQQQQSTASAPSDVADNNATGTNPMHANVVLDLAKDVTLNVVNSQDADEVTEYAASYMDGLMETLNDKMGEQISALYGDDGDDDDEGPSVDVLMLLATLALSRLGVTLNVNTDW